MKVLCIGESLLETTCPTNDIVKESIKYTLEEKIECGGGHAGNIACLLSKWGVESYIASCMGADDAATKIKKEYDAIGVKTEYIETTFDKPTSKTLIVVNNSNKNNTVFNITSNAYLKKYSFGIEPDIIISDGNDFNATVAAIDKYSKCDSYLMVNKYNNDIIELCKYAKNIIFNRTSSESITNMQMDFNNSSTLVNIYNKLKQKFGGTNIIITLGERGSLYSINNQIKIMPPVKIDLVDSYGAGDIYAGAFIYAMGRNFGLEKSIAYATIAASLSVGKMTCRNSIPSITEVSTFYDNKFGSNNNPMNDNKENTTSAPNMNTTENTNNSNNMNNVGSNDFPQNT